LGFFDGTRQLVGVTQLFARCNKLKQLLRALTRVGCAGSEPLELRDLVGIGLKRDGALEAFQVAAIGVCGGARRTAIVAMTTAATATRILAQRTWSDHKQEDEDELWVHVQKPLVRIRTQD
jgi:hypothetical protein